MDAGGVLMVLRLEATAEDEWYAFCFPEPVFDFLPDVNLDIAQLHAVLMDIKNLFMSILQKLLCIPLFLGSWRCWPLTLAFLAWWWLAWLWPPLFLPLAPLWVALGVRLLRQEYWHKRILWHCNVAPLNMDGFTILAHQRDTDSMEAWLIRLLGSMGRAAAKPEQLRELAGLSFRNATPVMSFEDLVRLLTEQPWVQATDEPRRCAEGHLLTYVGCTPSEDWVCKNHGGCQHPLTNKFKSSVSRYTCRHCGIDVCEPCVARRGRIPGWTGIPASFLPQPVVVFLSQLAAWAQGVQGGLISVTEVFASLPFESDPDSDRQAARLYASCALASLALALLLQLPRMATDEVVGAGILLIWRVVMILAVTWPLAAGTPLGQSLATQRRANAELSRYQQRRAAGGCAAHWAFFTPDAGCNRLTQSSKQSPGPATIQILP